MQLAVEETIKGSKEAVWNIITDIANAQKIISGIENLEVLETPAEGLVGLKWQETRTVFGKSEKEIMWITDAKEYESYQTRAESHGAVYLTTFNLSEQGENTLLKMVFEGVPQTMFAKLMSTLTGRLFRNATIKLLKQDLVDIKAAVEQSS